MCLSEMRNKALVAIAVFSFALGFIASCAHEHPSTKVPKEGKEHPSDTGGKEHPESTKREHPGY